MGKDTRVRKENTRAGVGKSKGGRKREKILKKVSYQWAIIGSDKENKSQQDTRLLTFYGEASMT
jgi:hypothetical protein